ncbi:MAG TPA: alpha/beta hydrolase [Thermoanaerobaculia bacterium]|jgi:acetyl esterase/lipase|nr:alpha/beta hydrolase [Thermoanaerobaculia bacterium]
MNRRSNGAALFVMFVLFSAGCRTAVPASTDPTAMTYREVDGRKLQAHVFQPASHDRRPRSAVILVHGGGWSEGSPEWTFGAAQRFVDVGMVAIAVEYRLSQGTVTPIEALSDVCAAFRWVRTQSSQLGIDPRRVAGYGISAGGHLVASTATVGCPDGGGTPDVMLLLSPAVDLARDAWFGRKLQERATPEAYSPVDHVRAGAPPTNIVIGAEDTLTPLAGTKRFCDRLREAGSECHLNVFDGVGHLLTRNLANQESDFDPDPAARDAGYASHFRLLKQVGFLETRP